jgi:ABC-type Fe3+-hydroxamate transport system substrate-binding protein
LSRIVCLVPSITELLCDLGLADQLVGRTGFCIHPREIVRRIPKVGGTKSVDLEKVRALKPTHVVVNIDENEKLTADAIAQFVPHLVVTHPLAPLDNLALYRQIGEAFDAKEKAERLCLEFQAEYEKATANAYRQRRVLYLIWKKPWMTVSRDTYVSRMLELVGLRTLPESADARYPELEEPSVKGVELILLASEPYRFTERHRAELQQRQQLPVRLIDGEMTSWYGPRAIAGLAYLAQFSSRLSSRSAAA